MQRRHVPTSCQLKSLSEQLKRDAHHMRWSDDEPLTMKYLLAIERVGGRFDRSTILQSRHEIAAVFGGSRR